MTQVHFNSELAAIHEERDHVTILMNLKQSGEVWDGPELNRLHDRLEELEERSPSGSHVNGTRQAGKCMLERLCEGSGGGTSSPPATLRAVASSHLDETEKLRQKVEQLEARVSELDELIHLDPLSNVLNRRGFFMELERLVARIDRYGGDAAMIFADVDGLKQINDRFGHQVGDEALQRIARVLVANVRASDTVARIAGDEFAILLPKADESTAWRMALRIFEATAAAPLDIGGDVIRLSVAAGACAIQVGDQPCSVVSRADAAMYKIKASPLGDPAYPVSQTPRFGKLIEAIHIADCELYLRSASEPAAGKPGTTMRPNKCFGRTERVVSVVAPEAAMV